MRNLKKFLALVLAMMMVFSLMVTVNAADFADADDVNPAYAEAVEVLAGIGVIEGDSHDELTPQSGFTRAHLATVAYRVGTGSDADSTDVELYRAGGQFDDVPESHWANPYINFAKNAEWVHGVNDAQTLYNPGGDVTGYHALTILLQILGYGKQGEFLGRDWQIQAARYGKEAGLTDGLINTTLTKAATREEVFQMMFNALKAHHVTYSADAKGYKADEETWGYQLFKLACIEDVDDWGRPVHIWFKDNNGDGEKAATEKLYVAINDVPVAEFHDIRSDCDIVDDWDLDDGDIVAYYVDGNKQDDPKDASTGRDAYLDELDVTDYIGGQGVLTEIYEVEAGYHIVQINTWLAKVTKVNASYEDKNHHTTPRTIDIEIYTDDYQTRGDGLVTTATGIANEVYVKGDYVLVYINQPYDDEPDGSFSTSSVSDDDYAFVQLVGSPEMIGSGKVTSWTSRAGDVFSTSTVGGQKLNESEKFVLNYHETTKNWAALSDLYGNLIGLGTTPDNYVVIDAISWIHNGVKGGYAAADLINTNGETIPGVTVAKIGVTEAKTAVNYNGTLAGEESQQDGQVADNYKNNPRYYGHLYSYSVNENNEYTLVQHGTGANLPDNIVDVTGNGLVLKGNPNIVVDVDGSNTFNAGDTVAAVSTDNTVFMVKNANDDYDMYIGKSNVPSVGSADICILKDESGYAVLVIIDGTLLESGSNGVYYVADLKPTGEMTIGSHTYNGYRVYALGSTESVVLYVDDTTYTDWGTEVTATGLYHFVLDSNGRISDVTGSAILTADSDAQNSLLTGSYNNTSYKTRIAGALVSGTSLHADEWDYGTNGNDISDTTYRTYKLGFNVTSDTKVYEVVKKNDGVLGYVNSEVISINDNVTMDDINFNDVIMVVHNSSYTASYIYIIRPEVTGSGTGTPGASTGNITIKDVAYTAASGTFTINVDLSGTPTTFTSGNITIVDKDTGAKVLNNLTIASVTTGGDNGATHKFTVTRTSGGTLESSHAYYVSITLVYDTNTTYTITNDIWSIS